MPLTKTLNQPMRLAPERQQYLDFTKHQVGQQLGDVRRQVADQAAVSGVAGTPYEMGMYRPFLEQSQDILGRTTAELGMQQLGRQEHLQDVASHQAHEVGAQSRQLGFAREELGARQEMHESSLDQQYRMFREQMDAEIAARKQAEKARQLGSIMGAVGAIGGTILSPLAGGVGQGIASFFGVETAQDQMKQLYEMFFKNINQTESQPTTTAVVE